MLLVVLIMNYHDKITKEIKYLNDKTLHLWCTSTCNQLRPSPTQRELDHENEEEI